MAQSQSLDCGSWYRSEVGTQPGVESPENLQNHTDGQAAEQFHTLIGAREHVDADVQGEDEFEDGTREAHLQKSGDASGEAVEIFDKSSNGRDQCGDGDDRRYRHPSSDGPLKLLDAISEASDCDKGCKRKASKLERYDLNDKKQEEDCSNRLKRLVDKMARLTNYLEWKHSGVGGGENWRCDVTDRIERRQKRTRRKLSYDSKPVQADTQVPLSPILIPDEIESALEQDILSYWDELDRKGPSAEECQRYLEKKYAGEVRY